MLPLALSSGQARREIQGSMAVVVPGGLITSTIDGLGLPPALAWRHGRRPAAA